MTLAFVPDRLVPLVGRDARQLAITPSLLDSLLEVGEGDVLEFKRQPSWQSREDKRELTADLASFANNRGGLYIIGADEGSEGVAASLTPVEEVNPDQDELRIRSIVVSNSAPSFALDVIPVSVGKGTCLVVSVPPSPVRPHAVQIEGTTLKYPMREGAGKRYLTESEVADLYRSRFAVARGQIDTLNARHDGVVDESRTADRGLDRAARRSWVIIALNPARPGSHAVSAHDATYRLAEEIGNRVHEFPDAFSSRSNQHMRGGHRCYRFRDNEGTPYAVFGELYVDGGGVVAVGFRDFMSGAGDRASDPSNPPMCVGGDDIVAAVVNSVRLLGYWTVDECGTAGDAALTAQLLPPEGHWAALASYNDPFHMPIGSPLRSPTPKVEATLSLGDVTEGPALGLLVRQLTQDLMAAGFERIEPDHIDSRGQLVSRAFAANRWPLIERWAEANGMPVA